jgi:hypothetical protein
MTNKLHSIRYSSVFINGVEVILVCMRLTEDCGVEPIISALRPTVIKVVAFGLVYEAIGSWISTQYGDSLLEMKERVIAEAVRFNWDSSNAVSYYVFNVGEAYSGDDQIQINGSSSMITYSILSAVVGFRLWADVAYLAEFTSGSTYTFKVFTARGTNAGTFAAR